MKSIWSRARSRFSLAICFTLPLFAALAEANQSGVTLTENAGHVDIAIEGKLVATYVYADSEIPRPYFCNVRTLDGIQVTRNHPPDPVANKGNDDHPAFHPGIWLAFGDISGNDFWRNKARVSHVSLQLMATDDPTTGRFSVVNRYEQTDGQGKAVCEETCTYTIHADGAGYFILSQSEFRPVGTEFAFGDQEEMGFGVRINTPITARFGRGSILNSEGGEDEEGTWGKQAAWCAAVGGIDGRRVGAIVMPDTRNFRSSWFHSRDYGLIVANPFAGKAMTGPDDNSVPPDSTRVTKGESFQLGFGVYIFAVPERESLSLNEFYEKYLKLAGSAPKSPK